MLTGFFFWVCVFKPVVGKCSRMVEFCNCPSDEASTRGSRFLNSKACCLCVCLFFIFWFTGSNSSCLFKRLVAALKATDIHFAELVWTLTLKYKKKRKEGERKKFELQVRAETTVHLHNCWDFDSLATRDMFFFSAEKLRQWKYKWAKKKKEGKIHNKPSSSKGYTSFSSLPLLHSILLLPSSSPYHSSSLSPVPPPPPLPPLPLLPNVKHHAHL